MLNSVFAFAAVAAAQGAATQSAPTWVPLQQSQQQAPASQTQAATVVAAPVPAVRRYLPAGTQVSLAAIQELSSKRVRVGEHYQFTVVNDVVDQGVVVIPRGSIADGVITMKTGRAIGGKSGKFDVTFANVTARGVTFPLMGVHRQQGRGNTVGALLGSILISGTSAQMLPGQIVTAMIKEQTAY